METGADYAVYGHDPSSLDLHQVSFEVLVTFHLALFGQVLRHMSTHVKARAE